MTSIILTIFFSIDPVLAQGNAFFIKGYYDEAITEYKRYVFFHPSGDNTSNAYFSIGAAYRMQYDWEQSIEAFRMAMHTARNDSAQHEAELALAVTYLASGNYSAAELILLKLEMSLPPPYVKKRAAFLRALTTMYAKKWAHAQKAFEAYFLSNPDPKMEEAVDSLIRETKDFYYLSPESARQLSMLIPGLGQIYARDWFNGINSFILNGAMIYWMGYKIFNRYYGDAWTIYFFLFRRYYLGSMHNAERIAEEHNDALDKKQAERILQLFLEE